MKKILALCALFLPFLAPAQQQPCTLLKNIATGLNLRELVYFEALQQAGDRLFFTGSTCTESAEVYALVMGRDSVYLPFNALPDNAHTGWCGVHPSWDFYRPRQLTAAGNRVFYTISLNGFGNELWVTDGTTEGSGLVSDIFEGSGSSSPEQMTAFRDELWFSATNGTHGRELWRSDGTPQGTQMVLDIAPGAEGSQPSHLCVLGDELFFVASAPGDGLRLWRSDGTSGGTMPWLSLDALPTEYQVFSLSTAGGLLFLVAANENANRANLYVGNVHQNTFELILAETLTNPFPHPVTVPAEFTEFGGLVYFAATTATHGRELWTTDGTPAGTMLFKDINPGTADSNPFDLQVFDGKIFFRVHVGGPASLYVSDGTADGTGPAVLSPETPTGIVRIKAGDGQLFFTRAGGAQLWRTDGTETEMIANTGSQIIRDMTPVAGGGVYFLGRTPQHEGVWKWSGVPGTMAVPAGSLGRYDGSSSPRASVPMRDNRYFWASSSEGHQQIWRTNGTPEGTTQVTDLGAQGATSTGGLAVVADSLLIFPAHTLQAGTELWVSNGQPGQESMIVDLQPGGAGAINWFALMDGQYCYFERLNQRLYRTDGTAAGTIELMSSARSPNEPVVFNGHTYMRIFKNGTQLLKTDGTPEGTSILTNIEVGNVTTASSIAVFAGRLWLLKIGPDGRWGLWRTNDDASGVELAVPLNPPGFGAPFALRAEGDNLYFFANDGGVNGNQLYISDGTVAGTLPFLDPGVPARPVSNVSKLTFWRGKLYYLFNQPEYGPEIFVSDGTAEGTGLFVDILPGPQSSDPGHFGVAFTDSLMFFTAFTHEHGRELWQTDGTPEGTVMVQDICPGPCSSSPANLGIIDNRVLLFDAYYPGIGVEPWVYHFGAGPSTDVTEAERPSIARLTVFPNPNTGDVVYVSLPAGVGGRRIEVLDLRGVVLASERIPEGVGRVHELALPGLSNGMYVLRLLDGEGRLKAVEKLLVIRR